MDWKGRNKQGRKIEQRTQSTCLSPGVSILAWSRRHDLLLFFHNGFRKDMLTDQCYVSGQHLLLSGFLIVVQLFDPIGGKSKPLDTTERLKARNFVACQQYYSPLPPVGPAQKRRHSWSPWYENGCHKRDKCWKCSNQPCTLVRKDYCKLETWSRDRVHRGKEKKRKSVLCHELDMRDDSAEILF